MSGEVSDIDDICQVFDESQVRTDSVMGDDNNNKETLQSKKRRKLSFQFKLTDEEEDAKEDSSYKKEKLLFPMPRWRAKSELVKKGKRKASSTLFLCGHGVQEAISKLLRGASWRRVTCWSLPLVGGIP